MTAILYVLKKILSQMVLPGLLGPALVAVGLFFRRRRWARLVAAAGLVVIWIFSLPVVSWWLLAGLEKQAGPYADPAALARQGVVRVVVLSGTNRSGGYNKADRLDRSVLRVLEGVRLWKQIPNAKLVLSGGNFREGLSAARAMAELALELEVPARDMVLEELSLDTHAQARELAPLLAKEPFALVTSAFHMPRALEIFRRAGLNPLPAPCGFQAKEPPELYRLFLPQARALAKSELALREHLGRAWYGLRGLFGL